MNYAKGDRYIGQWQTDKRNGKGKFLKIKKGVMIYGNGDQYDGDWKNDIKEGNGKK